MDDCAPTPLTKARAEAQRRHAQGETYTSIARVLGVCINTARRYALGLYGVQRTPDARKSRQVRTGAARARQDLARQYRARGWSVIRIARELGVSRTTVYKYLGQDV